MKNTLESSLALAENLFGHLSPEIKERLRAVVENPCRDTWDDAYSIIISPKSTLWQAVIEVDPNFPRVGKRYDEKGFIIKDWTAYPNRETLLDALFWATH